MSSNPFLDLPSVSNTSSSNSSSANPFMDLPSVNANPNNISKTQSFFAGAGQQLAKIGENVAGTVASGMDKVGLSNNSEQSIHDAFAKNVYPFYKPYTDANPGAALGGSIGGAIIGTAPTLINGAGLLAKGGAGAVNGYLNSDPNSSAIDKGINTLAGAGLNMLPGGMAASTVVGGAAGAGYAAATGGDISKDTMVGATIGLGAHTVAKAIPSAGNLIRGLKPALTNPSDIAEIATQKTLQKVGGDLTKATPETYFQEVDKLTQAAHIQKEALVKTRNELAQQEGVGVTKNNLADLVQDLQAKVDQGATSDTAQALDEGKRLLGKVKTSTTPAGSMLDATGNPIVSATSTTKPATVSYQEAQDLVSDIGSKINTANSQRNFVLANKLMPIKDAILSDIDNGGGSAAVKAAHKEFTDFYKNIYAPLRDVKTREMFDPVFAEKFSNDFYLANVLKSALKNPRTQNAVENANQYGLGHANPDLTNNTNSTMIAAHVNALKDAATTKGLIDPTQYGNSLAKTLKDNPTPLAPVADKLRALGNALDVASQSQALRRPLSQHSIGQKVALSIIAPTAAGGATYAATGDKTKGLEVAGASFFLPKTKYLYAAGKLLRNPDTSALLSTATRVSDKTDPGVASAVMNSVRLAARRAGLEVPYSEPELTKAANSVKLQSVNTHTSSGGSTYNLAGQNMIGQKKFSVSVFPDRGTVVNGGSITPKDVESFVSQNKDIFKDPKAALGTWYDKDTNKTYIDAVLTLDNKDDALQLAQKYNQKAIFDLHNRQEIPAGGTGESGVYTTTASERIPHNSSIYGKIIGRIPSSTYPVLNSDQNQSK